VTIYQSIYSFTATQKTIVTIGTFDGVHIGHLQILHLLVEEAKKNDCESLVLTFFPHPRQILDSNDNIKQLSTIDEKVRLLEKAGIDHVVIHPFDKTFSLLTAEEFVATVLVEKFNLKKIVIGHDHRFGKNRSAGIDNLLVFGQQYGFEVIQLEAATLNEIAVSSTKIRTAIQEGAIELANSYLNYYYSITGTVVKGNQLGRTIGFPTANIVLDQEYKMIPKNGVYIVSATLNDKVLYGMMNIGTRPTINGINQTIEVHFLDFNQDIYAKTLTLSILKKIREEQKFPTIEILKHQLFEDKNTTQIFIQSL
jgi:riboflavin kinase / FMN adenylyltransferase